MKLNRKSYETPGALAMEQTLNAKTGPVAVTYVAQGSCPEDCTFRSAGCYAETGPTGFITNRLATQAQYGQSPADLARAEASVIDQLPADRAMRPHVVGDSRTNTAARILRDAVDRYILRGLQTFGVQFKVWTYTHAWRKVNRQSWGTIGQAGSASVLASCETIEQARQAMAKGYAAALVVAELPKDGKAYYEPSLEDCLLKGKPLASRVKVIPCPAQTREDVTCMDCRLCWDDARLLADRAVIAFEAHGSRAGMVKGLIQIQGGN